MNKEALRAAFSAALYMSPAYRRSDVYADLWKKVLDGEKLPKTVNLLTLAGDYFAFWYLTLRGLPKDYYTVAQEFFEQLYPE